MKDNDAAISVKSNMLFNFKCKQLLLFFVTTVGDPPR
jgi:hypothetical protein